MIMQGCVISCGTVVFFQKSCNLSRSSLTSNSFYCASIDFEIQVEVVLIHSLLIVLHKGTLGWLDVKLVLLTNGFEPDNPA